ncbi:MAG: hypothetical protein WC924_00895 [Candidatus Gracilibacteria bacterium]
MYKRKCDFSKKSIISMISPDKPYIVYDKDIWWSDNWDSLSYGVDFDFSRPFFEQFGELIKKVPRINMTLSHCENSDYGPYSVSARNVYMATSCVESEDILYSYQTNHSRDCMDCMLTYKSELCYECIYGVNLYHCFWTQNCRDSSDLLFCRDCQGCEKCIGCVNLTQKKLHIFNQPVSEEKYNQFVQKLSTVHAIEQCKQEFLKFSLQFPFRSAHNIQVENCIGDRLIKSKNAKYCFEAEELEDCAYIYVLPSGAKDTYDTHYSPKVELVYEAMSASYDYNTQFVNHAWDVKNSRYVDSCFYSSNLFGCAGLKKNAYCILNKQYSKEEYEALVQKIIEHMKQTGEWGEFFPMQLSPYAYNESLAQDYFPLSQEQAAQMGLSWKLAEEKEFMKQALQVPEEIRNVPDDITKEILACIACGKNYRIIAQELQFYRKMKLPIPQKCPNCRYQERLFFRSSHKLYDRTCSKCQKAIKTTYQPNDQKIVFCEDCYLKEVYGNKNCPK